MSRIRTVVRVAAAVSLAATSCAFAAAGDIDATFGNLGFARPSMPIAAPAVSVHAQADGKVLVAGGVKVARFLSSGQPDTGFGTGGVVTSEGLKAYSNHRVLVALPKQDGQLWALSAAQSLCLASAGLCSVSGTFMSDDIVRIQMTGTGQASGSGDRAPGENYAGRVSRSLREMHIAPDGSILMTSMIGGSPGAMRTELHRLLPDRGAQQLIDYSALSASAQSCLSDVGFSSTVLSLRSAVDASGRILLATVRTQFGSGARHLCLVRLKADGTLDTQWGASGVREFADSSTLQLSQALPFRLVVRADQSLRLMLVETSNELAMRPRWLHLRADGSVDTSRGGGSGIDSPIATPLEVIQDIALLPDGRMFMVGFRHDAATNRAIAESPMIVSYGSDGITPDFFNLGGGSVFRLLSNAVGQLEPQKLSVMNDGTVYVAGSLVAAGSTTGAGELAVIRIKSNRPATFTPIDSGGMGSGGGGCGTIEGPTRVDPTLMFLMMLSLMALLARSGRVAAAGRIG